MAEKMKLAKQKKVKIYSFFPIDRGDCECQKMIREWKDKLLLIRPKDREAEIEKTGFLECPRSKDGMRRFEITCKKCGEVQGRCWASDETLEDFFDFHYTNWTNGKKWFGCFTPNISPISQKLTLECTCGQDTRDFRANQTLPGEIAEGLENSNRIGRDFGKPNSKFLVMEI